ncbi:MAG: AMP-binding protein [Magnetospirillum sp.]|nr:AMP-binding protein [Magnetospirillum sp.]
MIEPLTLPDLLAAAARGDAPVTVHGAGGAVAAVTSWRRLAEESQDLARRLRSLGLARGERIALMVDTGIDFLRLFFACQWAGAVPMLLPAPVAGAERRSFAAPLARLLAGSGVRIALAPSPLVSLLPGESLAFAASFAEAMALPKCGGALPRIGPGDLAAILPRAGAAGHGVALAHGAVLANLRAVGRVLSVDEGDSSLSWLPLSSSVGLIAGVLLPMAAGLRLAVLPTAAFVRDPTVWPRLMAESGATLSCGPAAAYALAARHVRPGRFDLGRWRVAGLGCGRQSPAMAEHFAATYAAAGFKRSAFAAGYGLAEATLAVSLRPPGGGLAVETVDPAVLAREGVAVPPGAERAATGFLRYGPALPGVVVEVRGPDGRPLSERRLGRLFVRSPALMEGYHRDAPATDRVLSADGWLDTGAVGFRVAGELVVVGRSGAR